MSDEDKKNKIHYHSGILKVLKYSENPISSVICQAKKHLIIMGLYVRIPYCDKGRDISDSIS